MKKLRLMVELEYDDDLFHGDDAESIDWFYDNILFNRTKEGRLILHSNEIGDEVGTIIVNEVINI